MQATKKGFLNIFYGILGQIITIVLGIVIPKLVLDSYGSEVNGLLNTVSQIFVCFSLLEAGVGVASLQALYTPVVTDNKKEIEAIFIATHNFYKKTGIIYGLAVIALAFFYPFVVSSNISYWLIFGIIIFSGLGNSINFFFQAKYKILMQAEGNTYICTNITTIINILINLVKAILLLNGFGVLEVQFSYFVITIIQMLLYYIYIKKHYDWIDFSTAPNNKAIEQKNSTLIHQISGLVFNNTDTLLLSIILQDFKVVSVYTMYNLVITMATTMIQQVESGFNFRLGQLYNTNRKLYDPLHHIFEIIYLILIFSVMTTIYVIILPFVRLYTASATDINYINHWYPLFFVLTPLLTYGRTAASNVINYAGHFKQTQNRAVLESLINIVVSIVAIWKFGIIGALIGTIVASIYRTNDIIIYTSRHLLQIKPWKTYRRWLVCFLTFVVIVVFVPNDLIFFDSYVHIIIGAIVVGFLSLVVYTIAEFLTNYKEFKFLLSILHDYMSKLRKGRR